MRMATALTSINFDTLPDATVTYVQAGQFYKLVGLEPYTRKSDGADAVLLQWATKCRDCASGFVATSGLVAKGLCCRCPACRAERYVVRWQFPQGLLSHIAQHIGKTAYLPNRGLAVAAAVMTVSKLIDRNMVGPTGARPVLNIAMVGKTCGKSHAMNSVGGLLRSIGLGELCCGPVAPNDSLDWLLRSSPSLLVDEEDAHLSGLMKELTTGDALGDVVRASWSARDVTLDGGRRILEPSVSFLVDVTPKGLRKIPPSALQHWLFVRASKRTSENSDAEPRVVHPDLAVAMREAAPVGMIDVIKVVDPLLEITPWDADVEEAFADEDPCGVAIRLAHVHAVSRAGREAVITMRDWRWAEAFVSASAECLEEFS
jgi:hypothetical protein